MVERGDYLVPYYRGEPFFDKPPLTYWLIAGSFQAFGFSTAAARLVPGLAALGVLLATFWLGRLLFDRGVALLGALVLATTLSFLSFGRIAMSDMLLSLFSTLGVGLAVAHGRYATGGWILPALGAILGLGFITKGPIALIIPGLAVGLLCWRGPYKWKSLEGKSVILAALLFGLFGLSWFVALHLRAGFGPLRYFFLRENLERFAAATYDTRREPWFYLEAYLTTALPWSLFLPSALWCFLGKRDGASFRGELSFLYSWMGSVVLLLSLSRGKIDYYILPLLPAASLVVAHYLARVPWGGIERTWCRLLLVAFSAALLAVCFVWTRLPAPWLTPSTRRWLPLLVGTGTLGLLWAALFLSRVRLIASLSLSAAGLFFLSVNWLIPGFFAAQPNREIVEDIARELRYRPDAGLALCEDPTRVQRDVLFHVRLAAQDRCDLWAPASSRLPFLLVLHGAESESLGSLPSVRFISKHVYLPASALSLEGLLQNQKPQDLFLVANYWTQDAVAIWRGRREWRRIVRERQEARERLKAPLINLRSPDPLAVATPEARE